ncbi:UNVERIFIED_CONTAM: hypothetical protein HDU68_010041 [Siphonaria sp. JEL0065]|nr:hypothetical protein HDU68_010041 [Siphonaria sp. JEL0065]
MPRADKHQSARDIDSNLETSCMPEPHLNSATDSNKVKMRYLRPETLGFDLPDRCATNCINYPPPRSLDPEDYEDDLTRELKANVAAIQLRSLKVQARVNSLTELDLYFYSRGDTTFFESPSTHLLPLSKIVRGKKKILLTHDAYKASRLDSPPQTYKALFPQKPQKVNYTKPPPPTSKYLSTLESIQPYKSIFRRSPSPLRREVSPSRPVRTLVQPTSAVDVAFEQLKRKPQPDQEPNESEGLALKMYCRTRNTEVLKCLQELSTHFTPNQVKRIYQILWEFEHHSVKDYYSTVESGVLFIRGGTARFRNPKVNYYDPSPSQEATTSSTLQDSDQEQTSNLPDLLQILDVFKSFESYPPPRHLPINAKMLQDCHNLSEQRLNPIKEPMYQHPAVGSSMTRIPSSLTTPRVLTSQPVGIALKSLDDVLADFQPGLTKPKKTVATVSGGKKIRKRKDFGSYGDEEGVIDAGTSDSCATPSSPKTPKKARAVVGPSGIAKPPVRKRAKRTVTLPLPVSSSAVTRSEWIIPIQVEPANASTTPMLMPMDPTALLYKMAFRPMIPASEGEPAYQEILDLFEQLSQDNQLAMLHTFNAGCGGSLSSELSLPGNGSLATSPLSSTSVVDAGHGMRGMLGGGNENSFGMDQLDWSFESSVGLSVTGNVTDEVQFTTANGEKEDEAFRDYMNSFELEGNFRF